MKLDSKLKGQVFTPPQVVKKMISLTTFSELKEEDLLNIRVLEPSAGDGSFALEIIKIIDNKFKDDKSLASFLSNNVVFVELDKDVSELLKSKILDQLSWRKNKKLIYDAIEDSIFAEDFLRMELEKFDYIFGNPPYINRLNINKDDINYYKENFKSMRKGNTDIYYGFIEKCNNLLTENGEMIFITPNNYLKSTSGKMLREIVLSSLNTVVDFGYDHLPFNPKATYTCISKFTKNVDRLKVYKGSVDQFGEIVTKVVEWEILDKKLIVDGSVMKERLSIDNEIKFRHGVATLSDEIFIYKKEELVKEDVEYYYFERNYEIINIEKKMIKKIYKGNSKDKNDFNYVIFPYKTSKEGCELITEEEMIFKYPGVHKYFVQNEEVLKGRSLDRRTSELWYAFGRSQGLKDINKPKIVINNLIGKEGIRFTEIPKDTVVYSGVYATSKKLEDVKSLLCNNKVIKHMYSLGQDRSGGYRTLQINELKEVVKF